MRWRSDVVGRNDFIERRIETLAVLGRFTRRVTSDVNPGVAQVFSHEILIFAQAELALVVVGVQGLDVPSVGVEEAVEHGDVGGVGFVFLVERWGYVESEREEGCEGAED